MVTWGALWPTWMRVVATSRLWVTLCLIDAALGRVLLVADVPTQHVIDRAQSVGCLCRVGLLYHGVPAFHLI